MPVWDLVVYTVFWWICDEKINKYQCEAEGQRWLIRKANRPQKQGGKDRPQAETNFPLWRTGKIIPTGWRIFPIKSSEWVRGRDGAGNRRMQGFPLVIIYLNSFMFNLWLDSGLDWIQGHQRRTVYSEQIILVLCPV